MPHAAHGQSIAAWATVIVMVIASLIGGLAVVLGLWWLFWIGGVGLVLVGGILGKVLSAMGFGAEPAQRHDPSDLPTTSPPG